MLPLLFFPQAATAPVGGYGGITVTQASTFWTATAWFGGTLLKAFTMPSSRDAVQNASIVLAGYVADYEK